jgi:hypothetical protein
MEIVPVGLRGYVNQVGKRVEHCYEYVVVMRVWGCPFIVSARVDSAKFDWNTRGYCHISTLALSSDPHRS